LGAAQIGVSAFVLFAIFAAAAGRRGLRRRATWAAMTASFGATLMLSYLFDHALPALPLLSLSFLAVNAGPLRTRLRAPRDGRP
jgi:hypothetical protein